MNSGRPSGASRTCHPLWGVLLILDRASRLERMPSVSAQRRKFSPQFKAEAVAMVIETGRPIAEVARDLGIGEGTLGNWVGAWRRAHPEPETPPGPAGRARLAELEEEVSRLRMENEFLKKAAAFFAR